MADPGDERLLVGVSLSRVAIIFLPTHPIGLLARPPPAPSVCVSECYVVTCATSCARATVASRPSCPKRKCDAMKMGTRSRVRTSPVPLGKNGGKKRKRGKRERGFPLLFLPLAPLCDNDAFTPAILTARFFGNDDVYLFRERQR